MVRKRVLFIFSVIARLQIPCKNVIWILMKIPCQLMLQIHVSLVQLQTKIHDHSMSCIQILIIFHAGTWYGFWASSSHGISMEFAKEMMGFPSDWVSFSS